MVLFYKACTESEPYPITLWSITHFFFWVNVGLYFKYSYLVIFIVSLLWEFIEIILYGFGHETIPNTIMDIIFNMLGFYIGFQLVLTIPNALICLVIWGISLFFCSKEKGKKICNNKSLWDKFTSHFVKN